MGNPRTGADFLRRWLMRNQDLPDEAIILTDEYHPVTMGHLRELKDDFCRELARDLRDQFINLADQNHY